MIKQFWTYKKMKDKILKDLDLEDETFIKPDELIGYFNEALNEAVSEIMELHQDYFLTKGYLASVQGINEYPLPYNIYANKLRNITYQNGAIRYSVAQFRRKDKFEEISMAEIYTSEDYYMYYLANDLPGITNIVLWPPPRDTAILTGSTRFLPFIAWYIRDCNRVPLTGEYCNPELMLPTQVNTGTNQIQTYAGTKSYGIVQQLKAGAYPGSISYITGDAVRVQPLPGATLPSPLVEDTTYYVIAQGAGLIKLAVSRQDAFAGTALVLATTGTVGFTLQVSATSAIIDATIIDIPEFSTFVLQWVKTCCLPKDGDPRYPIEAKKLIEQKKQMIDTLTKAVEDDDDTVQPDLSLYWELS